MKHIQNQQQPRNFKVSMFNLVISIVSADGLESSGTVMIKFVYYV